MAKLGSRAQYLTVSQEKRCRCSASDTIRQKKHKMLRQVLPFLYLIITVNCQCTCAGTKNICGNSRVKRVAGGNASRGEIPWMVGIFSKISVNGEWRNCSGTLINEQFVITSASCVKDVGVNRKGALLISLILGGVPISNRKRDPKSLQVSVRGKPFIHPKKGKFGATVINNFALIRLSKSVDFSRYPHIKPACLPSSEGSFVGRSGFTGGYGHRIIERYSNGPLKRGTSSTVSNTLNSLEMDVVSTRTCSSLYTKLGTRYAVAPENLCAVSEEGDLCEGDKGSGLVIPDCRNKVSELVGVSFYNVGCNSSISGQKLPHVFGRITPTVTTWINNILSSVGSSICSNNKVSIPTTSGSITTAPRGTVKQNPYCSDTCGRSKKRYSCDDRILGGKEACEHEFPWAALLEIDGKSRCGGNLINDRYILTAGHCFDNSDPNNVKITVTLGEHDTEERDGEYKATVSSYELHPRFKKTLNSLVFDFALIEIPPVDLRKYRKSVGPICLPTKSGTPVNYGTGRATAYGWGKETKLFQDTLRHNGVTISKGSATNLSTKLQKLNFNFVPQSECVSDYGSVGISLADSQLCAVSEVGDTCGGDSGGGLVRAVGDRYELVGIVSFGVGCDSRINGKKLSGVYARVTEALDWITESISDGQCYA